MAKYVFLVEVEVERDSGKFAGRDEISEKIAEALADAAESADLSGLGADSSSEYSVTQTDVGYLESKDLKSVYAEYDAAVIAELPGDPKLRTELKTQKNLLAQSQRHVSKLLDQVRELTEQRDVGKTRVYQQAEPHSLTSPRVYLADGPYDSVHFERSEDHWHDRWDVKLEEDGVLLVRTDTMGEDMVIIPRSSNEVRIKMVAR